MTAYDRTPPPGTVVRLVIPAATIVAHGELRMQVTLPGHPGDVVHLPRVDEHFEPLVRIHPHAPQVRAGQVWRSADGYLFFGVRWRPDDTDGGDYLVAADGGGYYTAEQAVDEFGVLTLLGERAPVTYTPEPVEPPVPAGPDPSQAHQIGYRDGRVDVLTDLLRAPVPDDQLRQRIAELHTQACRALATTDPVPPAADATAVLVLPRVPSQEERPV